MFLIILPIFFNLPYLSNITKTRLDPALLGLNAPENKVITSSLGTRSQNQRKMFNSYCLYRFLIFRFRYTNQTSCSSWDSQIGTLGFAKISLSSKVNNLQHYCHLQPTTFYDTLHISNTTVTYSPHLSMIHYTSPILEMILSGILSYMNY